MKQKISTQMDGGLNAQQFAENMNMIRAVQTTLYKYMEGLPYAEILEGQDN